MVNQVTLIGNSESYYRFSQVSGMRLSQSLVQLGAHHWSFKFTMWKGIHNVHLSEQKEMCG